MYALDYAPSPGRKPNEDCSEVSVSDEGRDFRFPSIDDLRDVSEL